MSAFTEQYEISFKGLGTGFHNFSFVIEDAFFNYFDTGECFGGKMKVDAEMEKSHDLLTFNLLFSGNAKVMCDRCLELFKMPLQFNSILYVRFDEEEMEKDAEVIYLDPKEHKLNLARFFMESICLNLPLKRVHLKNEYGESMCNKDMIKKLNNHRVTGNTEVTDPRWDALKKFSDKMN